jgi:hypothetical protein
MPSSTTHPHPSGRTITFTEADHVYRDCTGRQYLSVSGLLKRAWPKFNAPAVAARVAAREQRSVESVLAGWAAKRDAACDYGTRVHETAEACLRGEPPPHQPANDKEQQAFQKAWIKATELRDHAMRINAQVLVERALASIYYGIAGTADLILAAPDRIEIYDWKTNADLDKAYETLPPPLSLPASNQSKYELQLATYEAIIRKDYYPPGQCPPITRTLIWIDHQGKLTERELPDRQLEARSILLDYQAQAPF